MKHTYLMLDTENARDLSESDVPNMVGFVGKVNLFSEDADLEGIEAFEFFPVDTKLQFVKCLVLFFRLPRRLVSIESPAEEKLIVLTRHLQTSKT